MRVKKLAVVVVPFLSVMAVGLMWQLSHMSMTGMPAPGVPSVQQATASPFPTLPAHLAKITPVVTATWDARLPTPYFIDSEALAIQYTKELTETDDWEDYFIRRTNRQAYVNNFVFDVSTPVLDGDVLVWVVAFENTELMALWQAASHSGLAAVSEHGDELGMPGGYVAFLAFDDYGNVFGGGFLDSVDAEGNLRYGAGDWKASLMETIPEFP